MSKQPKRKWFQLSLTTFVVLLFVFGFSTWLNLKPVNDRNQPQIEKTSSPTSKEPRAESEIPFSVQATARKRNNWPSQGKSSVVISFQIHLEKDFLSRGLISGRIVSGRWSSGNLIKPEEFEKDFRSLAGIYPTRTGMRSGFMITVVAPKSKVSINKIRGDVRIIRATKVETVSWSDFTNFVEITRHGFTFRVDKWSQDGSKAELKLWVTVPKSKPNEPPGWRNNLIDVRLRNTEEVLEPRDAAVKGSQRRYDFLVEKEPEAIEITFVTQMKIQMYPFVVENIEVD